jgi:integrase
LQSAAGAFASDESKRAFVQNIDWALRDQDFIKERKKAGEVSIRARNEETTDKEVATLSLDNVRKLLACKEIGVRNRARLFLAFGAALRRGEVQGLKWQYLDLDSAVPTVNVVQQLLESGKFGLPKTEASANKVPLHPDCVAVLREWKNEGWEKFVGRKPTGDDLVFPTRKGTPDPWHKAALEFRGYLGKAGIKDTFTHDQMFREGENGERVPHSFPIVFHNVRHTIKSLLVAHGWEQSSANRYIRHSTEKGADKAYSSKDLTPLASLLPKLPLYPAVQEVAQCA